jgi:hypothetical protein
LENSRSLEVTTDLKLQSMSIYVGSLPCFYFRPYLLCAGRSIPHVQTVLNSTGPLNPVLTHHLYFTNFNLLSLYRRHEVRRPPPPSLLPRRVRRRTRALPTPLLLIQAIRKTSLITASTRSYGSINTSASSSAALHRRTMGYFGVPACLCSRRGEEAGSSGGVYEPGAAG